MSRRRIAWLSLVLTLTLPGLSLAEEPNRAGLVVWFGEGRVETRCVAFTEDSISGADLLTHSGLEVIMDSSSGLGVTVCQIEGWGCAYPARPCFCQCMGGGECRYWNYFYMDPGETTWTYSAQGALLRRVRPGSVEAWVWGDGHTLPADSLTFESICALPTTMPTDPPQSLPTQPTPTATAPTPSLLPTAPTPTATAPTPSLPPTGTPPSAMTPLPTPTPAPTVTPAPTAHPGPNLSSYWPFGLMVLGLALVGALIRLRRS